MPTLVYWLYFSFLDRKHKTNSEHVISLYLSRYMGWSIDLISLLIILDTLACKFLFFLRKIISLYNYFRIAIQPSHSKLLFNFLSIILQTLADSSFLFLVQFCLFMSLYFSYLLKQHGISFFYIDIALAI